MFVNILQQACIFLPLMLGIYLSYRILRLTDLTVDGSFVTGSAVFARLMVVNYSYYFSFLIAVLAGAMSGVIVSLIQRNNKVDSIVAGILAVLMLYSVNMQIMGKPNISLLQFDFSAIGLIIGMTVFISVVITLVMLHSRYGLYLRGFGINYHLLNRLGKAPELCRVLGLAISNALAAASGCLLSQLNGFSDINIGFGVALTAIGSLMIGQHLIKKIYNNRVFSPLTDVVSCFVGIFIYFFVLNMIVLLGIDPVNIKFVLAVVLIVALRNVKQRGQHHG